MRPSRPLGAHRTPVSLPTTACPVQGAINVTKEPKYTSIESTGEPWKAGCLGCSQGFGVSRGGWRCTISTVYPRYGLQFDSARLGHLLSYDANRFVGASDSNADKVRED